MLYLAGVRMLVNLLGSRQIVPVWWIKTGPAIHLEIYYDLLDARKWRNSMTVEFDICRLDHRWCEAAFEPATEVFVRHSHLYLAIGANPPNIPCFRARAWNRVGWSQRCNILGAHPAKFFLGKCRRRDQHPQKRQAAGQPVTACYDLIVLHNLSPYLWYLMQIKSTAVSDCFKYVCLWI